jgi:hypothetical protein
VSLRCLSLVLAALMQAGDGALSAAHARTVWAERALLLLDELARADDGARARAEARLRESCPRGAGAAWYPPLEALARATRELTGISAMGPLEEGRGREQRELQALVDAVDLVVVPGCFAPRATGLGEPTTVHVRCAFAPAGLGEIEMRLLWRGPLDELELARSEPASVEALRAGFPMYLRPPLSTEGTWWLVPEIAQRGLAARGVGVRVDCAAAPPAPTGAPGTPGTFDGAALAGAFAALRASGARSGVALGAGGMADVLAGLAPSGPRPLEVAFTEADGSPRYLWGWAPAGTPRLAIAIVCADHELADLPLAGAVGERWHGLAEKWSAWLFSVNAPSAGAGRTTRAVLERTVAAARERGLAEGAPIVAVARGAAVARLAFEPIEGLSAAVLSTVVHSEEPERVLDYLPRLLVAPGGSSELSGGELGEFTWVDGSPVVFLNELALPGWVDAWLERR